MSFIIQNNLISTHEYALPNCNPETATWNKYISGVPCLNDPSRLCSFLHLPRLTAMPEEGIDAYESAIKTFMPVYKRFLNDYTNSGISYADVPQVGKKLLDDIINERTAIRINKEPKDFFNKLMVRIEQILQTPVGIEIFLLLAGSDEPISIVPARKDSHFDPQYNEINIYAGHDVWGGHFWENAADGAFHLCHLDSATVIIHEAVHALQNIHKNKFGLRISDWKNHSVNGDTSSVYHELTDNFAEQHAIFIENVFRFQRNPNEERYRLFHSFDIEGLIAPRTNPNIENSHDWGAFLDAIKLGASEVEKFLDRGVVVTSNGHSALHVAAMTGASKGIIDLLVSKGFSVHDKDVNGQTPLHLAAREGKLDVLKALLDKGADVNSCDDGGNTALHNCAWPLCADLLVSQGSNVNICNGKGMTPIQCACELSAVASEYGVGTVLEVLIRAGADVHTVDHCGRSILHHAIRGHSMNLEKLIGMPSIQKLWTLKDKRGASPLYLAIELGNQHAVDVLIKAGAQLWQNNNELSGDTLLHAAVRSGVVSLVEILLENGYDSVDCFDKKGNSPLDIARELGNERIVACLEEQSLYRRIVLQASFEDERLGELQIIRRGGDFIRISRDLMKQACLNKEDRKRAVYNLNKRLIALKKAWGTPLKLLDGGKIKKRVWQWQIDLSKGHLKEQTLFAEQLLAKQIDKLWQDYCLGKKNDLSCFNLNTSLDIERKKYLEEIQSSASALIADSDLWSQFYKEVLEQLPLQDWKKIHRLSPFQDRSGLTFFELTAFGDLLSLDNKDGYAKLKSAVANINGALVNS